jgi:membrane protease YdiL (CAAX protease family)
MSRETLLLVLTLLVYSCFQLLVVYANQGYLTIPPLLIVILFMIIYDYIKRGSFLKRYSITLSLSGVSLGIIIALASYLIIAIFLQIIYQILGYFTSEQVSKQILKSPELHSNTYLLIRTLGFLVGSLQDPWIILSALVCLIASVAVVEELLFRGIFLDLTVWLLRKLSFNDSRKIIHAANVFQAAIFAAMHFVSWNIYALIANKILIPVLLIYFLPLFILGLILGFARLRFGSLSPEIVAHFFYDLLGMLILLRTSFPC